MFNCYYIHRECHPFQELKFLEDFLNLKKQNYPELNKYIKGVFCSD